MTPSQGTPVPLVSVILPTLNAVGIIQDCLDSLNRQTYPNLEIIGVDAGSSDGTAEIMASNTRYLPFQLEPWMPWGTPYQVVFGAGQAKGEYLYFVDSDMVLLPEAVETYVRQIREVKADALIVPEISFGEGFWAACKVLERSSYLLGDSTIEAPRFMRKSVWDSAGGYDPSMGGILDWDFHKRLRDQGTRIIRGGVPVYHNEGQLTLKKLMKKKFTYGKTAGVYLRKHWRDREVATSQFNPLRPVYFRNWRAFVKDPVHTAGMMAMKLAEGTAFGVGLLSNRLRPANRSHPTSL
jgi:glycosyltransferase involved in cell wall biosynthesis